uniref:hypothetical protein n=1 Tax=Alistipes sp. TaxID=1872444 RepID=UPI004055CBD8
METNIGLDILKFLGIMLAAGLFLLAMALMVHRRRQRRKRDYTDPMRDRIYHDYKDKKQTGF